MYVVQSVYRLSHYRDYRAGPEVSTGSRRASALLAARTSSPMCPAAEPLSTDPPRDTPQCSVEACCTGALKSVSTMDRAYISASVVGDSAVAVTSRCTVEHRASNDASTWYDVSTDNRGDRRAAPQLQLQPTAAAAPCTAVAMDGPPSWKAPSCE